MRNVIFKDVEDYYEQLKGNLASYKEEKKRFNYYSINEDIGDGGIERIIIGNGIEMSITKIKFYKDFELEYKMDKNLFEIIYCVDGDIIFEDKIKNEEITIKSGDIQFWKNQTSKRWIKHPKNTCWNSICVYFDEKFFKRLPQDIETINEGMLEELTNEMITFITLPEIKMAFNQILNEQCGSNSISRLLHLQSKAIEIVSLFIEKEVLHKSKVYKNLKLRKEDIHKIKEAKALVTENIINPLSIEELSKVVGLNTYKLKVGFKEVYEMTIFGYLRDIRMERAKEYLLEGEMSILEVAYSVGYSNPSHFAVAFRKKYGINPSQLQIGV